MIVVVLIDWRLLYDGAGDCVVCNCALCVAAGAGMALMIVADDACARYD